MEDIKEISASDLYDYRRDLCNWKYKGPSYTIGLIVELSKVQYTQALIQQTKIIKTIKNILTSIKRDKPSNFTLFNRDQLNSLRLKLHNLYVRIKEVRDEGLVKRQPVENQGDLIFQVTKDFDEPIRTTTDYLLVDERERYRDILVKEFKKILDMHAINKPNFKETNFKSETDIDQKIVDLCVNIEKKIYQKNLEKITSKVLYQDDLKTMIRYLTKDQSGQVFINLLNGLFPVNEAVQLHLVDWAQDDKTYQSRKNITEFDANYYKDIRFKEMTQAQGQMCQKCETPYIYLIQEKQIRRADEPSTKFYECFACGHKYKL